MTSERSLWPEAPDAREAIRLELVALAAELVTVSHCIAEALRAIPGSQADAYRSAHAALAERASSVLDPQNQFDDITTDALRVAAGVLREDRRGMLKLREQAEELALRARSDR